MERCKLSLRKGGQMQLARKNVISDPYVICGCYEVLSKELECWEIQDKTECKYICDKSRFSRVCQSANVLG